MKSISEQLDRNYIVEKANKLITSEIAEKYDAEMLKMLDVYLSKINARDPDTREVIFTKQELCKVLGIHPKSDIETFIKAAKKLTSTNISFVNPSPGDNDGCEFFGALFSTGYAFKENGELKIRLLANFDMMWVFFNLQAIGYTSYRLGNTLSLKNKQSILLYQNMKMWLSVSHKQSIQKRYLIDELRLTLAIKGYEERKNMTLLLNRCVKEINEKTDIKLEMDSIKNGNILIGFEFVATSKKNNTDVVDERDAISSAHNEIPQFTLE